MPGARRETSTSIVQTITTGKGLQSGQTNERHKAHSRRESQQSPLLGSTSRSPSPMSQSSVPSSSTRPYPTNRFGPSASASSSLAHRHGGLTTSSSTTPLTRSSTSSPVGIHPIHGFFDDDMDDELHTFSARDKVDLSSPIDISSWRGWANALGLLVLLAAIVILFAGYPIIQYYHDSNPSFGGKTSGYNLGGINSTGQFPIRNAVTSLIDPDTPADAMTHAADNGETWDLVFSDEFNEDGRTFWDGDDPFFQAVDLHYWGTNDFEYYHPSAVTTKDGHLVITMNQEPIGGLNFKSGMIQSWNKLCFNKNAYVEVSISLPGVSNVGGFWPGVWLFANLGRPGYGATTDGTWPYSYDSCDVGILPNQTYVNETGPAAALDNGQGSALSYLPGQRFSSCTCPDEPHPGPDHTTGRGVPEIDIIEAQIVIDEGHGEVSQTYQIAPYDTQYKFDNVTPGYVEIYDRDITYPNTYLGGLYQQSCSRLTAIPNDIYIDQPGPESGNFKEFGVEYVSNMADRSKGYILWSSNGKNAWKMYGSSIGPNEETEVGQRVIAEEPMALVFNLGMSNNFQNVDFNHIELPNYMRIDYVRVYQNGDGSVGCDPDDHPTAKYIEEYSEVYNNNNLTTWGAAGYEFPKNKLTHNC